MSGLRRFVPFVLMPWVLGLSTAAAGQYAVLVGIHDYLPQGAGGPDLPGVENDLRLMQETLVRCYGFAADAEHMATLRGSDATRAAIIAAIQEVGARVGADDAFLFFYSGHGTYLDDDNGDEDDGYDEAICPADARTGGPIRDDELGRLLDRVRGHKVVILDSCFSGTATRDITFRTMGKSFTLGGARPLTRALSDETPFKDLARGGMDHVLIAGCQNNQTSNVMALDYPPGAPRDQRYRLSALTYFLCLGLRGPADQNNDGTITYEEATHFARERVSARYPKAAHWCGAAVKTEVVPGQTVQLEGPGLARPVFGRSRYEPLEAHMRWQGDTAVVDVGAAHGFEPGTTLRVQHENAEVRIDRLGLFESGVAVIAHATSTPPANAGTPVTSTPLPAAPARLAVRVAVSGSDGATIDAARRVAVRLRSEAFLNVVEDDDAVADIAVRLHRSDGRVMFTLAYPGGRVDTGDSAVGDDPERLIDVIRGALAQAYAVRCMAQLTNPEAGFSVRLRTNVPGEQPVFRIGQEMQLLVSATAPCYVTLIDIGTSGTVSVLYPPAGKEPPRLTPGETLQLPPAGGRIRVNGPPGLDRLKAIATREPLPLSTAVQTKGPGVADVAERILGALKTIGTTAGAKSPGQVALPANAWAETSIGIEIEP